ncbi:hypothetical protein PR048_018111 [Dryococelus australis]|uniref:Uncharacterized protein n=1 Tax=Dryococelus australis TaxID=614101 RepID=A0ABQ9HBD6_9NEOP|nr:hypothetical protein PR048_018111 [Dryococelus australis]
MTEHTLGDARWLPAPRASSRYPCTRCYQIPLLAINKSEETEHMQHFFMLFLIDRNVSVLPDRPAPASCRQLGLPAPDAYRPLRYRGQTSRPSPVTEMSCKSLIGERCSDILLASEAIYVGLYGWSSRGKAAVPLNATTRSEHECGVLSLWCSFHDMARLCLGEAVELPENITSAGFQERRLVRKTRTRSDWLSQLSAPSVRHDKSASETEMRRGYNSRQNAKALGMEARPAGQQQRPSHFTHATPPTPRACNQVQGSTCSEQFTDNVWHGDEHSDVGGMVYTYPRYSPAEFVLDTQLRVVALGVLTLLAVAVSDTQGVFVSAGAGFGPSVGISPFGPFGLGGFPFNFGGFPFNFGGFPFNFGGFPFGNGVSIGVGGPFGFGRHMSVGIGPGSIFATGSPGNMKTFHAKPGETIFIPGKDGRSATFFSSNGAGGGFTTIFSSTSISSEAVLLTDSQCDKRTENLPRRGAPGREPATLRLQGGEKGVPRENPPACGIVQHDLKIRKWIALVGEECANHCTTTAPTNFAEMWRRPIMYEPQSLHIKGCTAYKQRTHPSRAQKTRSQAVSLKVFLANSCDPAMNFASEFTAIKLRVYWLQSHSYKQHDETTALRVQAMAYLKCVADPPLSFPCFSAPNAESSFRAGSWESMRVIDVGMEQRRSGGVWEMGDPREGLPACSIVRHDCRGRQACEGSIGVFQGCGIILRSEGFNANRDQSGISDAEKKFLYAYMVSSGTILRSEKPGASPPGIEPGSPRVLPISAGELIRTLLAVTQSTAYLCRRTHKNSARCHTEYCLSLPATRRSPQEVSAAHPLLACRGNLPKPARNADGVEGKYPTVLESGGKPPYAAGDAVNRPRTRMVFSLKLEMQRFLRCL